MVSRQERREVMQTLPEDMAYLKEAIRSLKDHTGLADEEAQETEDEKSPKEEVAAADESEEAA